MHSSQALLTIGGIEDPLLPKLIKAINQAQEIEVAVSFVRTSGYNLLSRALIDAMERGVKIRFLTSDYLSVTEPTALRALMLLQERGADVRIHQHDGSQSFHMKSYIFVRSEKEHTINGCAFVGSSNISRAALLTGHEWNLSLECNGSKSDPYVQQFLHIREQFEGIFLNPRCVPLTHNWIDAYLTRYKPKQIIAVEELTAEELEGLEVAPTSVQQDALSALDRTRQAGYKRGLVVLATGLGKTWLAAFDSKQCVAKRVLFVAHREEILLQAEETFVKLRPESHTGFYKGQKQNDTCDLLFASVQTLGRQEHLSRFAPDHFDYIIVDEFHHASAKTYRNLLNHFQPKFLLGLTATPERTDQADILSLCDNNLVFERNLAYGINSRLLAPFHYYGIADECVDYEEIPWRNGKFATEDLTNALASWKRAKHVLEHWQKNKQSRTLAFCISKRHAEFMAEVFRKNGFKAQAVYSGSSTPRNEALSQLEAGDLDILFSIDLFNEGTDLPAIDTVLMLRPTESKIIFLQQLGRGLRLHKSKQQLVVIDFIGNHKSFLLKPMTLHGAHTAREAVQAAQGASGTLPHGCYANYDPKAIDMLDRFMRAQKSSIVDEYQSLKSILGYRPTATEFYHYLREAGINFSKVHQQNGSWFKLVISQGDLSQEDAAAAEQFHEFLLNGVEKAPMTKSFKMILLEAFMELDGFDQPPTEQDLAEKCWHNLNRRPELFKRDLTEKYRMVSADSSEWLQYWQSNPIKAFARSNNSWFSVEKGRFSFSGKPTLDLKQSLQELTHELLILKLEQYQKRS